MLQIFFWIVVATSLINYSNGSAYADFKSLDPDKKLTQYLHESWVSDVPNSLPQSTVYSILQSKDGYLWIGTHNGLARFDGVSFTNFYSTNTENLLSDRIVNIFQDSLGYLWLCTQNGLVKYNFENKSFSVFLIKDGLIGKSITSIAEDNIGNLWIGGKNGLSVVNKTGKISAVETPEIKNKYITVVKFDSKKRLWLGTKNAIYIKTTTTTEQIPLENQPLNESIEISSIIEDVNGNILVGSISHGLLTYDGEKKSLVPFLKEANKSLNNVTSLLRDRAGALWIGTTSGLYRIYKDALDSFLVSDGLTSEWVMSLYEDSEGSLWVGTNSGGLNRLRDEVFTVITEKEGISDNLVNTIIGNNEKTLWVGTIGGNLNVLNSEILNDKVLDVIKAPSGSITDLWALSLGKEQNEVYFSQGSGKIFNYKDGVVSEIKFPQEISKRFISSLLYDDDGLWIGTFDSGLHYWKDGKLTTFTTAESLLSNDIRVIYKGSNNTIWVGSSQGIDRIRLGQVLPREIGFDLKTDVSSFHEDRNGIVYIGTYINGLKAFWNNKIVTIKTNQKNNPINEGNVYSLLEDNYNTLWVTSNRGIFSVNKKELESFLENNNYNIKTEYYNVGDGLRSQECNSGKPSSWKTPDGRLWFPTMKGLAVLNPKKLHSVPVPPKVHIEKSIFIDSGLNPLMLVYPQLFEATKTETLEKKEITFTSLPKEDGKYIIPRTGNRIEFNYTGIYLKTPSRVQFKYKLEGYDASEVFAEGIRTASYNNLPPGDYTFKVSARISDGEWASKYAEVSFRIKPIFYETTWFLFFKIITGVILVSLISYLIYKFRLRQLNAIADDLAHQVRIQTKELKQSNELLQKEQHQTEFLRQQAESLLLNVLPQPIAERLKSDSGVIADKFDDVTVLFCDIVGFTPFSAKLSPEEVVDSLNDIFTRFDRLTKKYGVEKIKTIGDAYMVAGGLPIPQANSAELVANLAIEIRNEIDNYNIGRPIPLSVRIGMHSGPVVAGVIGLTRFIYDLWGDTVNIASRMESHGLKNQIQISEDTFFRLQNKFIMQERGTIEVKGKGSMKTYWLIDRKTL